MNLKGLTEQRAEKQNEMEKLLNTVKEEQRAFSDEESELFTQLESDIQRITETINAIAKGRELTEEPTEEEKEEKKEYGLKDSERIPYTLAIQISLFRRYFHWPLL